MRIHKTNDKPIIRHWRDVFKTHLKDRAARRAAGKGRHRNVIPLSEEDQKERMAAADAKRQRRAERNIKHNVN